VPADPTVDRMIQLHKKLEALSRDGGSIVDGWRPLRLDSNGWVVAGKNIDGDDYYQIEKFYPSGEWKKAAKYLEIENELRALLFSDLTSEQLDAYRAATGLGTA
jgi:hypothetical protein